MYDDYPFPAPDCRTELAILLEDARRLLKAYWAKDDHAYGEHYADYEADRMQLTLHNLFGDAIPAPRPATARIESEPQPVPPVHNRRSPARRMMAISA